MDRLAELKNNLDTITREVREAEQKAGREPGSVTILPVTKFHPAQDIALLAQLGITMVGENREQEAKQKKEELGDLMEIAMIGQIQTKKANSVARWASSVHSLDSVKLARALNRGMDNAERTEPLPCLIQISFDDDANRGGVAREELPALVEEVAGLENVLIDGFMVVPPIGVDPVPVFETSKSIALQYENELGRPMKLSAGMSADFVDAVASGSDIVRVGTKLLGTRPVL
ncbi:YggS family pyridoxal phosphate-dependent enzyme [Corynebacterium tuscaniense]|uniref:Pyridoxal phosphate homeostasis protein n=1 Tax=Corynebacterium tuscaniense TaxID=302449 RepID=A0A2N6T5A2_9CORY|nr:YggS family pyridoxal phosphate-dependent enzyme [Corynebacterium tuscaniense]KAA8746713.1 YggS family pyridoxal phosphate-dependent enzyme [Corynebacterium tuscaniense]KGF24979.1 hypothetical protein HMPREF2129_00995 [Corynebacterium tuscaniense DNF00037]PMC64487.1 YggS family pyridoxal phosphate-dependent enzyme [Corynebacterium tuscaniense]